MKFTNLDLLFAMCATRQKAAEIAAISRLINAIRLRARMKFLLSTSMIERQRTYSDQEQKRITKMLNAIGRGDTGAFKTFYIETSPKVFGLLLALLHERSCAEEALRQIFLSIWQQQKRYCPAQGDPLKWLSAVASEHAINLMRNNRRETRQRIATVDGGYSTLFANQVKG